MRRSTLCSAVLAFLISTIHTNAVQPEETIVLANGCAYTPNLLSAEGAWSLVSINGQSTGACDLTIYVQGTLQRDAPDFSLASNSIAFEPQNPVFVSRELVDPLHPAGDNFFGQHYSVGTFR